MHSCGKSVDGARTPRAFWAVPGASLLLFAIGAMLAVRPTRAECPNACNGHGNCGYFDICHCYRGWQSADCSQRTCAYGYAFTTTPQGDLNMDGDREDNSFKQLSEPGSIHINTNTLTFARSGLQSGEIKVGDGVRICSENFIVNEIRGRTIVGNDDFLDATEHNDVSHTIDSATEHNHKRRIKELVLDGRHTQNCGTMPGDNHHSWQGSVYGTNVTGVTFTKSSGPSMAVVDVGATMFVYCHNGSDIFKVEPMGQTSENQYGYLKDNVYLDGGMFLTVAEATPTRVRFYERFKDLKQSGCYMITSNHHPVYRHITTQQRPNGDWEKWKGDFKGTNTRPEKRATTLGARKGKDEGHFYMECSNQGLCDRVSGICTCFDGYTGRACQRQQCPGDPLECNGHGVCLSVEQMRTKDMTKLPITCKTTQFSTNVTCDGNLWDLKLETGDYVKIGAYPPIQIGYMPKKSTAPGTRIDTFTLKIAFPESLPYGAEVWQVHKYDLWDKEKNMACKCDPLYTGFDCSERKCPMGNDPLTDVSIDKQQTEDKSDDSPYPQQVEKQTLIINSESKMLFGHFTLQFEDSFGDRFETKPIPIEVELSVTASVIPGSYKAVFDTGKGLPASELSRGDQIRMGTDIRFVEKIVYKSKLKDYIMSFEVRDEYLGGLKNAEKFYQGHAIGTRVYRQDVSKEIREALLSLPNDRIQGVSVEKIEISGDFIASSTNYQQIGYDGRVVKPGSGIDKSFTKGDLVRIRSHIRVVASKSFASSFSLLTDNTNALNLQSPPQIL